MIKSFSFSGVRFWHLILCFSLFLSCKKDKVVGTEDEPVNPPGETPDLVTKIASTVSGFVTDENNIAVSGADVKVGNVSVITDRYGYFSVKDVQVVKEAATVAVSYPGYFRLVKTYKAAVNKGAFFRIKLMPKEIAGVISAPSGGIVDIPGGASVTFPANAIKTASGALYNGVVSVAAQYLDPTSNDLNRIMPGDLRGISTENRMRLLTTYGMIAVELTGAAGEPLQIADGKRATISMPIPASYRANAPADIPLWYFDENTGLWKEEGKALNNGNRFTGEVAHFSFWNCDQPQNFVNFNCTIVTTTLASRTPLSSVQVRLTQIGNPTNTASGWTDSSGYTGGIIPANVTLLMEVLLGSYCSPVLIHSQTITVSNSDISLGDIVVTPLPIIPGSGLSTLSGTVTACNGEPVRFGRVMAQTSNGNFNLSLDTSGRYMLQVQFCNLNQMTVVLTAYDFSYNLLSTDSAFLLPPDDNMTVNLSTCDGSTPTSAVSNGYFYHPTAPREIVNLLKDLEVINSTTVQCPVGDLGGAGYFAYFEIDPITNLVTVSPAPVTAGAPFYQWDSGLPTDPPGPTYTPQWSGSALCKNTYDPATRQYRMRYGYIGGTGFRVIEEIIQLP